MVPSFLRRLSRFSLSWKPLEFSNSSFTRIPASQKIEEETIPDYITSRYYPTRIGEDIERRYQVVGKLGYGATSRSFWVEELQTTCYTCSRRRYVTLKIFITSTSMGQRLDDELRMYKRIEKGSRSHPGHQAMLGTPTIIGKFVDLSSSQSSTKTTSATFSIGASAVVFGVGLFADNIMFGTADDSIFRDFEEAELQTPSPRKELDGRIIYLSRELGIPKALGPPVLCDFGSAIPGDIEHSEYIQPNIYRAPEVILEAPWTYSVDIWNTGCMIWDIFEGESLFTGHDPEFQTYRSRAHLSEMIRLLGPPPPPLLTRGNLRSKFFSAEGMFCFFCFLSCEFCAGIPLLNRVQLEERESTFEGEEKLAFLRMVRRMLQWQPEDRRSAKELEQDKQFIVCIIPFHTLFSRSSSNTPPTILIAAALQHLSMVAHQGEYLGK
ncbi:CMGC/CLK protein kinase [Nannizzia gypsea CBS 118893]|uniref:CMGC/CLK protein kinase n=1 Tax=Arthroderma gypseum (strain ATCC MYA-4604 / CBS 118893) TaxID=535722 RepID=E4UUE4_ARTGP|nr:CMGC/CLK protein kinase [Nannizzia gypsea CBS 118893]EFR00911.1 CMGC/CLK protein kinase [Nannizzia gypsea CBS 118893]